MEFFDFKCKYCGGEISELDGLKSIGKCKYCGSKQTLPKLYDEKRATFFGRANHMRRNNEFDKAEGLYEQLLNEDPTDPEAYWSLVLCRFGIEYVEDTRTKERKPTINRTQMTSIFADEDYKSAIKYADKEQKTLYEHEANEINEIQKGILEISMKEEPFDVFICYKETDTDGKRSIDSVLAHELYRELTRDGYKVFFARETLHNKIGSAYEPYIFSALNSAKVMVVLGTKKEHFEAVWVRNEWSRFLGQIKKGEKKVLFPVYRDMSAYELPQEFANLQALDMNRLGYLQELISGVENIVKLYHNDDHKPEPYSPTQSKPPKKSKKGAIISVIALILAITIGFTVFTILRQDGPNDLSSPDQTTSEPKEEETEYREPVGTLQNDAHSITITSYESNFPADASAEVKEIKSGADHTLVNSALPENVTKFHAFDISILSGGKEYTPNGKVTVTLPLPDDINATNATVFYVSKQGEADELDCTVSKGSIRFTTDHFSIYVIAEKETSVVEETSGVEETSVVEESSSVEETSVVEEVTVVEETSSAEETSAIEETTIVEETNDHVHTVVVNEAVEPTCTGAGLKEGSSCSVCGEVIVKQEIVDATGHSPVVDEAVDPTCTKNGLTEGSHCSVCKEVITQQTVLTASGHRAVTDERVDPTCTQTGLTPGSSCSVCGEVIVKQEIVDATGHSPVVDEAVDPTCTKNGLTEGSHCSVCKEVITQQNILIASGHRAVTDERIDPTCTQTGLTPGSSCSVCGEVILKQEIIAATGHDWNESYLCNDCNADRPTSDGLTYNLINNDTEYEVYRIGTCTDTDVVIPKTYNGKPVTSISNYAFYNCSSLTSITIPNSIKNIGNFAFMNCSSLQSFVIPNGVTNIGNFAFYGNTNIASISIPNSITTIGANAFYGCSNLKSITIPYGVTRIGSGSLAGCIGLESITVDKDNTVYHSSGNCLIKTESKELIAGCKNSVIPTDGSVTSILSNSFQAYTSITSVIIPEGVTAIGSQAFEGCSNLQSITIPESLLNIGDYAFQGCENLTSISIPTGIKNIGHSAFSGCTKLRFTEYNNGKYLGNTDNPHVALIEVTDKTVSSFAIHENTKIISDKVFESMQNLVSITIPGGIVSIGTSAFNSCKNLTSVTIPDSVTCIGSTAFYFCSNLKTITFIGTEDQWNAIEKGSNWNTNAGSYTVVFV